MKSRSQRPNHEAEVAPSVDDFSFSAGPHYADKSEYIDKGLVFSIDAVEFEPGRGFEGGDRWAVTVEPEDGRGPEILTFGCNEKRDQQLTSAKERIARRGPILGVRSKKSGKAFYLENGGGRRAS